MTKEEATILWKQNYPWIDGKIVTKNDIERVCNCSIRPNPIITSWQDDIDYQCVVYLKKANEENDVLDMQIVDFIHEYPNHEEEEV
jgi:hypothetical protein